MEVIVNILRNQNRRIIRTARNNLHVPVSRAIGGQNTVVHLGVLVVGFVNLYIFKSDFKLFLNELIPPVDRLLDCALILFFCIKLVLELGAVQNFYFLVAEIQRRRKSRISNFGRSGLFRFLCGFAFCRVRLLFWGLTPRKASQKHQNDQKN